MIYRKWSIICCQTVIKVTVFTAQLPKELIPSGMERGWGDCDKVLIKDLDTMKLFKQEIDKRIDLLKDHIEIMQEEIEYKEDGL